MNTSLCHTFQWLGYQTWERLELARTSGLFWNEETITETILMELMLRQPSAVKVKAFTKRKEARNGADWEWWLGSPGGWLGMRVQAKRLKLPSEQFVGLQRQKAKGQPLPQIDTLLAAARADQLNPIYCFYANSQKWPSLSQRKAPRFLPGLANQACFIAHADNVKRTGSNALSKLAPHMSPWHFLVCPCLSAPAIYSTAELAGLVVGSRRPAFGQPDKAQMSDDDQFPFFGPRRGLPPHMKPMLEPERGEGGEADAALAKRATDRNLAGFVLIRTDTEG